MKGKKTTTPYIGYDYQTLQGVKLLTEWLDSPTRYTKMAFEADKDENGTPEVLDDIVCERPGEIRDYWQVKFTPSPQKEDNRLTWDWLLEKKGKTERSRSILKKLSDALSFVPADKLGRTILLTNKLPDRLMEDCIECERIDFLKIDSTNQQKIVEQLGGQEKAVILFSKLEIQHSDYNYCALERHVRSELSKHSDLAGIERLLNRSRQWVMFKDNPSNNGWIKLHNVRGILSSKRPTPITEAFTVPEPYCLPDVKFHNDLINQIRLSPGEIITLTGEPGLGKSTYLSFLCNTLDDFEIPLIRHHYFLHVDDTTYDRSSPGIVAESFLDQIHRYHKEAGADISSPEKLEVAIKKCAKFYKSQSKPFVVLIDGLDHVWRDNAKNKRLLDETFSQLLPVVDNMVLLVGTQSVDKEQLPKVLLNFSPKEAWVWLPEMSGNSIYEFIKYKLENDRLHLSCHENHYEDMVRKAANELLLISNGYPLHVIYSTEYLAENGKDVTAWEIKRLPPCTNKDIKSYYNKLWGNLTCKQKNALILCCGFEFTWPRNALSTVVNDSTSHAPSVNAISHMLSEDISGVRPFHESLIVYIKNTDDYQVRISALLPNVCDWLRQKASKHIKDAWLWSTIARNGDSDYLRQGVTRNWVLDHLVEGTPVETCLRLLSEAETYAFEEVNFSEAYKHNALKTRLINGPMFQTWDAPNLEILSLVAATEQVLNQEISSQNRYSPTKLAMLSIALWHQKNYEQARLTAKKVIDMYRAKNKLLNSKFQHDIETETTLIIKACVLTDTLNYDAIFENDDFPYWSDRHMDAFKYACISKNDLNLLMRARVALPKSSHHAAGLELAAIRTSIIEEADITARPEYTLFTSQKISRLLDILSSKEYCHVNVNCPDPNLPSTFVTDGSISYHYWFFSSLCTRLEACGDFSWLQVQAKKDIADISIHFNLLNRLADITAEKIISGDSLSFDFMCTLFSLECVLCWEKRETRSHDIALKKAWIEISADCHLLTISSPISCQGLNAVLHCGIFRTDWLRTWYKDLGIKLLDDEAMTKLVNMEFTRQKTELESTIEYSNGNLELAEIAYKHCDLILFAKCLRKAWNFVLGYGHYKDRMVCDVLRAIKYLSSALPDKAIGLLEQISPIIFNISNFTFESDVEDPEYNMSSLLSVLNPQTVASIYSQQLKDGEWASSDETMLQLIEHSDFSKPIVKNLFLTGLDPSCCLLLKKQVDLGNESAKVVAQNVEELLGIKLDKVPETKSSLNAYQDTINIHPSEYPPNKLKELTQALSDKCGAREFWGTWYQFWLKKGKGTELLENLLPIVSSITDFWDDKCYLLDCLYESEKKLNGKTKAFKLLVKAHNVMNGWSIGSESIDDSLKRLKIIAQTYPKQIDKFINLTTTQTNGWHDKYGKLIIPGHKLVYLLAESGRKCEALELTKAMVDSLVESVRNLPLKKPEWDWGNHDTTEEALAKTLVSRLKLPVPSIKLWVIEQISELLLNQYPNIENLVINDLKSRTQESECVEVLSLFLMAKDKGYSPPNDLGKYVNARSTLTDMILRDIDAGTKNFGSFSTEFTTVTQLTSDNNHFNDFQGSHVPLIYNKVLNEVEQVTGIPLTNYFRSEWNRTFEYCPASSAEIDYFFAVDRFRCTGNFYTQASHRGRSAFLRAIENAMRFHGISDNFVKKLATHALPIEPAYIGLSPKKPKWLSTWPIRTPPTQENISNHIKQCINQFSSDNALLDLAALSLPIYIDDNTWIDVTVIKAVTDQIIPTNHDFDEHARCLRIGSLLKRTLKYEFNEDDQSETVVLLGTTFTPIRYGHFHNDLESRGLYVPKCFIDGKSILGKSENGYFYYSIDGLTVGYSSYWNNNWKPIHPNDIRSLCGTYTALKKAHYSKWFPSIVKKKKQFYVCKASILTSKEIYKNFDVQEIKFTISDDTFTANTDATN